ncbi:MAG: hypothetical protein IPM83_11870 [Ignavibacteria bacterium]|nr:hypothetical protein [Ignavibacteria bacterium]
MTPAQMLAHVNVSYEYTFGERTDTPPWFMRALLKIFLRPLLVGDKQYAKNTRTAPSMVMKEAKDFDAEMKRLKTYMQRIYDEGEAAWDGRKQITLGVLTSRNGVRCIGNTSTTICGNSGRSLGPSSLRARQGLTLRSSG